MRTHSAMSLNLHIHGSAGEIIGNLGSIFLGSVNSGLAQLSVSDNRSRMQVVFADIFGLTLISSLLMVSIYVALNQSFIGLWVGEQYYAGISVVLLIGVWVLVSTIGSSYMNALGAFGDFHFANLLCFGEASVRFGLMWASFVLLGLAGIPIAGCVTGVILMALASWRIKQFGFTASTERNSFATAAGIVIMLASGVSLSMLWYSSSWREFGIVAVIVTIVFSTGVYWLDSSTREIFHRLLRSMRRG